MKFVLLGKTLKIIRVLLIKLDIKYKKYKDKLTYLSRLLTPNYFDHDRVMESKE